MIVVRLLLLFLAVTIAGSVAAYLFTRNRRYLRFAWLAFQFAIVFAMVFAALWALERLVLI